jgi:hypothetical protein
VPSAEDFDRNAPLLELLELEPFEELELLLELDELPLRALAML